MEVPDKIQHIANQLRAGRRINRITVRDFLSHFGAERRGANKVQEIRAILKQVGLRTEPDFEMAWIGAPIWLKLENDPSQTRSHGTDSLLIGNAEELEGSVDLVIGDGSVAVDETDLNSIELTTTSSSVEMEPASIFLEHSQADPIYRIGNLPAANKPLTTVNQNDSLKRAITLMLKYDFSQLPIMQGEREVKGMISWKSIGSRHALGVKCFVVADCREEAVIVEAGRSLFDVIPTIIEFGYVLVRDSHRRITGVVTASDLSKQFQELSQPFLMIREIELHLRDLLASRVSIEDLRRIKGPDDNGPEPKSLNDLSFGEYVRLIQQPQVWDKLSLNIDAPLLTGLLEEVRVIRNDVMHFDPDPLTAEQLESLRQGVNLLRHLYETRPSPSN